MPKIYKDKICGYQLEYTIAGTRIGIKREDEINYQWIDLLMIGLDFVWDGTKLGVKKGLDTDYQYLDVGGANLEFDWNGYELGVRQEGETNYIYTNLRGASFEYIWNGTKLGIKTSDDANFSFVELKGEQGDPNTLSIGSVQMVDYNMGAVSITGTAPNQILNLDLPVAEPTNFTVGTVGEAEEFAVNITGTAPNQKINFLLKRGNDLEFNWSDTKLGVRSKGSTEYVYTDLKGAPGDVSLSQLENAIDEIRGEIDEKIGDIDLSSISSIPYGSIFNYPVAATVPSGYITEDSPPLLASDYPHLVPILGTTNLAIGSLELNLTSNVSDPGFRVEFTRPPAQGQSQDAFFMFDGNTNTGYSLSGAQWTQVEIKLSGEKAKAIKDYSDNLRPVRIRVRGTYVNNSNNNAQPQVYIGNGQVLMISGSWIAGRGETIEFDVMLDCEQSKWSINKEDEHISLHINFQNGSLNIKELEFLDVPRATSNTYIKVPLVFSSMLKETNGNGEGGLENAEITNIMYMGEVNNE